jgi:hypothetical protein
MKFLKSLDGTEWAMIGLASVIIVPLVSMILIFAVVSPVQRVYFSHEVSYQSWRGATTLALEPCESAGAKLDNISAKLAKGTATAAEEVSATVLSHRADATCKRLWKNVIDPGFWDGLESFAQPPGPAGAPNINALVYWWDTVSNPKVSNAVSEMVLYKNPVGAVLTYDKVAKRANVRAAYINKLSAKASGSGVALKLPMWPIYYVAGAS